MLTTYNRINILATTIALLVSGICYYFFIHYQLINQLDKDLNIEELEIIDYVRLHNSLPKASSYKDQTITFESLAGDSADRKFYSKRKFNPEKKDWGTIRQMAFPIHVGGKAFKALVTKSQQETDHLIQLILLITLTIVVVLLLGLFIINRFILHKLWRPFNTTLQQLKQFNLTGKKELRLEKTNINEFLDLNNAVDIMSSRVNQDYEALKSFTENASHEIQTPLAIIQSKLELLMQSENLQEDQVRGIHSMHDASMRLSKMNQSLILLTKIDNHQFQAKEAVSLGDLVRRQLNIYEELMTVKQIAISTRIEDAVTITMNEVMAEILLSNLITNAIKHNIEGGRIQIELSRNQLVVSNTGPGLKTNPSELFGRFKKDNQDSNSLGLGLSIVKKICEQNNFSIDYSFHQQTHIISVDFR